MVVWVYMPPLGSTVEGQWQTGSPPAGHGVPLLQVGIPANLAPTDGTQDPGPD